jgi:hypothetical protein
MRGAGVRVCACVYRERLRTIEAEGTVSCAQDDGLTGKEISNSSTPSIDANACNESFELPLLL